MKKVTSRGQRDGFVRAGARCAVMAFVLVAGRTANAQESAAAPPPGSAPAVQGPTSAAPAPAEAPSQSQPLPAPPASPADPPEDAKPGGFTKTIGGHIGVATPLVTVASDTTTIGDQFTILNPIGIGFHVSDDWIVDFETVVANPIHPTGTTGLIVDPGVIDSFGRVALGLRLAFQTNHDANVGLIPLLNVGLVDLGGATWFVEAAFPTFYSDKKGEFNTVLHTGIGF